MYNQIHRIVCLNTITFLSSFWLFHDENENPKKVKQLKKSKKQLALQPIQPQEHHQVDYQTE